jgi:hypothetical protein
MPVRQAGGSRDRSDTGERREGSFGAEPARVRPADQDLSCGDRTAQERYSEQRGGRARRATGNQRAKPLFDDATRVLLTLLYQRQVCSMKLLGDMLEVTPTCIGHLVAETRRVLEDHGHQPGYAPNRFTTAHTLMAFLDTDKTPPRTRIMESLSHPRLTGMSRTELDALARRLAPRQNAPPLESRKERMVVGAGRSRLTKWTVHPGLLNTRGPYDIPVNGTARINTEPSWPMPGDRPAAHTRVTCMAPSARTSRTSARRS